MSRDQPRRDLQILVENELYSVDYESNVHQLGIPVEP